MKYTVFYKPDGTVISTATEQADIETIKIGTFEVPDGNVIDSIDTSKKEHRNYFIKSCRTDRCSYEWR